MSEPRYALYNEVDGILRPVRDTWEEAASDAVTFGAGRWVKDNEFQLDWPWRIKAVRE